jgi:hypothetical protein
MHRLVLKTIAFGCGTFLLYGSCEVTPVFAATCVTPRGTCSVTGRAGEHCVCRDGATGVIAGDVAPHRIEEFRPGAGGGNQTVPNSRGTSPQESGGERATLRPAPPPSAPADLGPGAGAGGGGKSDVGTAGAPTRHRTIRPAEAANPNASHQILTTRNFFGPHDIPPIEFAAYGIVAFPQKFTSDTRQRYMSICEAYVATLPSASSSPAATSDQMVTVWPIDNPSLAERLNGQGDSVCTEAVEHYDLGSGLIALKEATTQEKRNLTGRGPYLLGWAPSSQKGAAGSLVLIADLSNATTPEHYREGLEKWRTDIEQNPKLWRDGWSEADIIIIIRDWADKWGSMILTIGHADSKNE